MKQYYEVKATHPDALLLFRVGDFYETFSEDAVAASKILGITLTQRKNGGAATVELAGFPYHSLDTYLPRLVRAGLRVAICEQLEDPKSAKGIVKRGVTELVSPGLTLNEKVLDSVSAHYLACIGTEQQGDSGLAFLDISTGDFFAGQGDESFLKQMISAFQPREILLPRGRMDWGRSLWASTYLYPLEEYVFQSAFCEDRIQQQFGVAGIKGFGLENLPLASISAGAVLHYLEQSRHRNLPHINTIQRLNQSEFVWMDDFTIRNLELVHSVAPGGRSLFQVMDRCVSPMGSRLLQRWLLMPLRNKAGIEQRWDMVGALVAEPQRMEVWKNEIKQAGDLERIVGRLATLRLSPREIPRLAQALETAQALADDVHSKGPKAFVHWAENLPEVGALADRLHRDFEDEPAVQPGKGPVFRAGFNAELDEYRQLAYSGKDVLVNIQQREMEATGIGSLKIGFNHVFGYYLEVTHVHKDKVPQSWMRKQTLVNAERYITPELKTYEEKILGAEEKIVELETRLYEAYLRDLHPLIPKLQQVAQALAMADVLLNFGSLALDRGYRRPEWAENHSITLIDGRHPVIEEGLPPGEKYIPNSVHLDGDQQQILVITGPNMAGKSALLRQTALTVILAQAGSFVPAVQARLGITDRIFTRVGASDNLSQGESTFMVEMNETAAIMNNLSDSSLVLLDEIGRGTSTYDGISIAWSLVEYLHNHSGGRAKTLFATHYHELNELQGQLPRVKNFHVSIQEKEGKVVFLRKLLPGGSEHSFGIHVAKMAGMPLTVVRRAEKILAELESSRKQEKPKDGLETGKNMQLSFFQLDDPALESIRDELETLDVDNLTPVQALLKLNEIKRMVGLAKKTGRK
ncbi:MAG: DNA mismatch repair protein MutS [Bacteroidia bacterium]